MHTRRISLVVRTQMTNNRFFQSLFCDDRRSMASAKVTARPGSRAEISEAFFNKRDLLKVNSRELQSYFDYYTEELKLLYTGISEDTWQAKSLATKVYEDIFYIVNILRQNGNARRADLYPPLRLRFLTSEDSCLNRSLNLAIRLWLMINAQEDQFGGIRHEVTCVQWDNESTLDEFVQSLFPKSRWPISPQASRLGPYFTAAFMQNVCGLKVEWTTGLQDHLRLDRRRKALKVFPYKGLLQALVECSRNADGKTYGILENV